MMKLRRHVSLMIAGALGLLGVFGTPAMNAVAAGPITITNPGTQLSYLGQAVYLQIHATDSNKGATLSYGSDLLPAGISVNPRTGLISGRPTLPSDDGVFVTDVTVSDSDGATATAPLTWSVIRVFVNDPIGPVRSGYPGKCLEDRGGRTATGNPIVLRPCDGSAAQTVAWNSNSLEVMGKCVDNPGASENVGTPLRLAPCNNAGVSQFLEPSRNGALTFFIDSPYCLDAPHSTAGTRLVLGMCPVG